MIESSFCFAESAWMSIEAMAIVGKIAKDNAVSFSFMILNPFPFFIIKSKGEPLYLELDSSLFVLTSKFYNWNKQRSYFNYKIIKNTT